MQIAFWKWEGAGNDFILVDGRTMPRELHPDEVTRLCDRHHGIGADGLIVLRPLGEEAPGEGPWPRWEMDYCNADGTRSFCGNGSRASFAFLVQQGWAPREAELVACDGAHRARWDASRDLPGVELRPIAAARHLGAAPEGVELPPADHWFADSGSPHHVAFLADGREVLEGLDVDGLGGAVRRHAVHAPAGANANFVADSASDVTELWARTFERGVEAETRACGTGATAIAVADYMRRGGPTFRRVHMPGGTLEVTFDHDPEGFDGIWLHGPAREAFTGVVDWPDKPERPSPNTDVFAWLGMWVLLLSSWTAAFAGGDLSDEARISLLTGSPGSELWSAWGHTAVRVYDPGVEPPLDAIYNYGTFAFGPGFYAKFLAGELDYRLSREPFGSFQISYLRSGRGLLEQPLDLAPSDVRQLAEYLEWNHLPENRTYRYRFLHDNCATRVLTVMEAVFGERWDAGCSPGGTAPAGGSTYREALRPYLSGWPWAQAGVEWAMGPGGDSGPPCFASFLPDGLSGQIQSATLDGRPIASKPVELVPRQGPWFSRGPWVPFSPSAAAAALVVLALSAFRISERGWKFVSRLPLLLAGMVGVVLTAAWLFTDHRDLWANVNLLWSSPLLLVLYVPRVHRGRTGRWMRAGLFVFLVAFLGMQAVRGVSVPLWMHLMLLAVGLALEPWRIRKDLHA